MQMERSTTVNARTSDACVCVCSASCKVCVCMCVCAQPLANCSPRRKLQHESIAIATRNSTEHFTSSCTIALCLCASLIMTLFNNSWHTPLSSSVSLLPSGRGNASDSTSVIESLARLMWYDCRPDGEPPTDVSLLPRRCRTNPVILSVFSLSLSLSVFSRSLVNVGGQNFSTTHNGRLNAITAQTPPRADRLLQRHCTCTSEPPNSIQRAVCTLIHLPNTWCFACSCN